MYCICMKRDDSPCNASSVNAAESEAQATSLRNQKVVMLAGVEYVVTVITIPEGPSTP